MLPNHQLKITDFYNIPIGNVKKLVPNFLIKISLCFIMKLYLRLGLKLKKMHRVLEFHQLQWLKQ